MVPSIIYNSYIYKIITSYMSFLYFRMDKKVIQKNKTFSTLQNKPRPLIHSKDSTPKPIPSASNSNVTNINITPNNNTPKNVNHRSKSNLIIKDNGAVSRLKSNVQHN